MVALNYMVDSERLFLAVYLNARGTGLDSIIDPYVTVAKSKLNLSSHDINTLTKKYEQQGFVVQNTNIPPTNHDVFTITLTAEGVYYGEKLAAGQQPSLFSELDAEPVGIDKTLFPIFDLDDDYSELENRIILELTLNPQRYEYADDGDFINFAPLVAELNLNISKNRLLEILYNLDHKGIVTLDNDTNDESITGHLNFSGYERGNLLHYILELKMEQAEIAVSEKFAPASDRVVRLDDNSPEVVEIRSEIDRLIKTVEGINDPNLVSDISKELFIVDLESIRKILTAKRVTLGALTTIILPVLYGVGARLQDALSTEIAQHIITLIKSVAGI